MLYNQPQPLRRTTHNRALEFGYRSNGQLVYRAWRVDSATGRVVRRISRWCTVTSRCRSLRNRLRHTDSMVQRRHGRSRSNQASFRVDNYIPQSELTDYQRASPILSRILSEFSRTRSDCNPYVRVSNDDWRIIQPLVDYLRRESSGSPLFRTWANYHVMRCEYCGASYVYNPDESNPYGYCLDCQESHTFYCDGCEQTRRTVDRQNITHYECDAGAIVSSSDNNQCCHCSTSPIEPDRRVYVCSTTDRVFTTNLDEPPRWNRRRVSPAELLWQVRNATARGRHVTYRNGSKWNATDIRPDRVRAWNQTDCGPLVDPLPTTAEPHVLGIELEIEFPDWDEGGSDYYIDDEDRQTLEDYRQRFATELYALMQPEQAHTKSDGSLDESGIEIVTGWGPLDALEPIVNQITRLARSHGGRTTHNGNCGLHIAIGRQQLSAATQARMVAFFNNTSNRKAIRKFARRDYWAGSYTSTDNYYCSRHWVEPRKSSGPECLGKYVALNTSHGSHLECRIFKATTRRSTILACASWLSLVASYCSQLTDEDDNEPRLAYGWPAFAEWYADADRLPTDRRVELVDQYTARRNCTFSDGRPILTRTTA